MQDAIVLVTRHGLGSVAEGDEGFGLDMLDKLFHTLEKRGEAPAAICFWTEGVRAVCEGSPVLLGLRLLEGMGSRIVACGSCLDRYGLRDRLAVGEVGGMDEIVALLAQGGRVVTV